MRRIPRLRLLAAVGALLALVAACDSDKPTGHDSPAAPGQSANPKAAQPPASATPEAKKPAQAKPEPGDAAAHDDAADDEKAETRAAKPSKADDDGPKVELLAPGREPRKLLRYRYQKGRTEKVRIENSTEMKMAMGGRAMQAPSMPPIEIVAALTVLEVKPDGGARRKLLLQSVGVADSAQMPAQVRSQLNQALSGLEGLEGLDVVDAQGRTQSVELDTSAMKNPALTQLMSSMQQSLTQMGAPFPDEEVGVGARWRVHTEVEQQGMTLDQTATYELVKLEGNKGKAELSLRQSAPPGPMHSMGVETELVGMKSVGSGQLEFDLERSIPTGNVTTRAKIQLKAAGAPEVSNVDALVKVKFAPLG